jgi:hypothetical protein
MRATKGGDYAGIVYPSSTGLLLIHLGCLTVVWMGYMGCRGTWP